MNFTATYTYTPATTSSGGGNPPAVGSGGGSGLITNQPVGGWTGNLLIGSNGVLNITTGDSLIAPSAENYGIINQTGGNFTLSGNLHQVMNFYSDTNGSTKGIYNISGGTASFGGITGNGFVNISGGTLTATTVNHTGVITQTGGTFYATNFTQTGSQYVDASGNGAIGGSFQISGGTAHLGSVSNAGIITIQYGGTVYAMAISQTDSTYFDSTSGEQKHFGVLNINGGVAYVSSAISGNGTVIIDNAGYLAADDLTAKNLVVNNYSQLIASGVVDVQNLSMDSTGYIDLSSTLIIRGGLTLSQAQALIDEDYDDGDWDNGVGIGSYHIAGIANVEADTASGWGVTSIDGISVDPGDILIEIVPYSLNMSTTVVPEPASLGVMALGGVALLNRRRR